MRKDVEKNHGTTDYWPRAQFVYVGCYGLAYQSLPYPSVKFMDGIQVELLGGLEILSFFPPLRREIGRPAVPMAVNIGDLWCVTRPTPLSKVLPERSQGSLNRR